MRRRGRLWRVSLGLCWIGLLASGAAPAAAQERQQLNVDVIERVLGMTGTQQNGEYKVTVPQNDLKVSVDGFEIIPPMGMGSWAAFTPAEEGAMVMGDIVVQESEIGPVEQVLIQNGLTVTGLHNHFVREEPNVMYMHIGGMGSEEDLAHGVKAVFDKVAALRGEIPPRRRLRRSRTRLMWRGSPPYSDTRGR